MVKVKRVTLGGSGGSPLRISTSGVDVDLAEFNTLIFDGNQSPLRLSQLTWVHVEGMSWNEWTGGQNTREATAGAVISSPSGTTPIWLCTTTSLSNLFMTTPNHSNGLQGGAGSSICQSGGVNYAIGVCHNQGFPAAPLTREAGVYVNFAVMKNWT